MVLHKVTAGRDTAEILLAGSLQQDKGTNYLAEQLAGNQSCRTDKDSRKWDLEHFGIAGSLDLDNAGMV